MKERNRNAIVLMVIEKSMKNNFYLIKNFIYMPKK